MKSKEHVRFCEVMALHGFKFVKYVTFEAVPDFYEEYSNGNISFRYYSEKLIEGVQIQSDSKENDWMAVDLLYLYLKKIQQINSYWIDIQVLIDYINSNMTDIEIALDALHYAETMHNIDGLVKKRWERMSEGGEFP